MKADPCLLYLPLLMLSMFSACRAPLTIEDDGSRLAEVSIQELENQDYTSYQFALEQQDGSYKIPRTTYNRGSQSIAAKVPVGTYKIILDYFKDKDLTLSTSFCKDGVRNDVQAFKAGLNSVVVSICNIKADPVASTVVIKPVPTETAPKPGSKPTPTPTPTPTAAETFTIQNGNLVDPSGKTFILRGINIPFAYYFDQSFNAIENTKAMGFNSVRVVWCADNYQDPSGRCQTKDFRPAADLDRVLTKIIDQRMVPVFNLQNATGQNTADSLQLMADYLIRDDIKAVLMKHKKNIIVNIANEWMGDWAKNRTWVDGYKAVVAKIRKAGLPHVLIVDARGYGQDFSSIEESATELMALDKNLIFSSHMYAVYNTDQMVQEKLNYIRSKKIPYMIGEFGCSHFDDKTGINNTVACDAILREAANSAYPIGHMAWSYAGNRQQEVDLDVFNAADWKTLSAYGEKVVNSTYGVKATSKQACFFDAMLCQ
ncbi:MAG TPA: cellulase family glycosylhydrolase [Oligoflexus sp.]|uniref:glycoside hydrolase family 5 protein n=1 Tax=Oligoflexus sp. TaxID=1971216 RepID=UPI002D228199|nr:cellulase family glycosylhydrolase [Oligoflexus sp.]HYX38146.1 cellulase family glycosylhydrolase [Oligoflexus sp.]